MPKHAVILVTMLAVNAATSSCQVGADRELQPYRCLGELSLRGLIDTVGLPQSQPSGWGVSSGEVAMEGRVFDLDQETTLTIDEAAPFVGSLCRQLEAQLARRCQIRAFWPGVEHCAAVAESPTKAITGKGGVYTHRSFKARVNLFASPGPTGKVNIVLTGSEWVN